MPGLPGRASGITAGTSSPLCMPSCLSTPALPSVLQQSSTASRALADSALDPASLFEVRLGQAVAVDRRPTFIRSSIHKSMNSSDALKLETSRAVLQRLQDVTAYLEGAMAQVSDITKHVQSEIAELEDGFAHFEQEYMHEGALSRSDQEI